MITVLVIRSYRSSLRISPTQWTYDSEHDQQQTKGEDAIIRSQNAGGKARQVGKTTLLEAHILMENMQLFLRDF